MTRPAVSVVMPFAGTRAEADTALAALGALATGPEDELILADNAGVAAGGRARDRRARPPVSSRRRTPATRAPPAPSRPWILFLDADCTAPADLLDRFFAGPRGRRRGRAGRRGHPRGARIPPARLAARYGAAKSFLDQDAHLAHPFMPRAVAANLLVRREAFEAVGGFYEGVRAAEDTDFSWRLQRAGWRLEGRREATVRAPLPHHRARPAPPVARLCRRAGVAGSPL